MFGHFPGCRLYPLVFLNDFQELAQTVFANTTKGCTESQFYICRAKSNFGVIDVDFDARKTIMAIRTPEEQEEAHHIIDF